MTPSKNGNTLEWRITQLERVVCNIDAKIQLIMDNHLAHVRDEVSDIRVELEGIKSQVKIYSAVNFLAIVAGIIFAYIMKV